MELSELELAKKKIEDLEDCLMASNAEHQLKEDKLRMEQCDLVKKINALETRKIYEEADQEEAKGLAKAMTAMRKENGKKQLEIEMLRSEVNDLKQSLLESKERIKRLLQLIQTGAPDP